MIAFPEGPTANRALLFGDYTALQNAAMLFGAVSLTDTHQGATMKKTLIRFVLVAGMLLGLSATTAMADGGGFPPLCYPGTHCQ